MTFFKISQTFRRRLFYFQNRQQACGHHFKLEMGGHVLVLGKVPRLLAATLFLYLSTITPFIQVVANKRGKTLTIGGFYASGERTTFQNASGILKTVEQALRFINERSQILPGYKLDIKWRDTKVGCALWFLKHATDRVYVWNVCFWPWRYWNFTIQASWLHLNIESELLTSILDPDSKY